MIAIFAMTESNTIDIELPHEAIVSLYEDRCLKKMNISNTNSTSKILTAPNTASAATYRRSHSSKIWEI